MTPHKHEASMSPLYHVVYKREGVACGTQPEVFHCIAINEDDARNQFKFAHPDMTIMSVRRPVNGERTRAEILLGHYADTLSAVAKDIDTRIKAES